MVPIFVLPDVSGAIAVAIVGAFVVLAVLLVVGFARSTK